MNEMTYVVLGSVLGLLGGFFILKALTNKQTKRILEAAEKEGEQLKTDKILQAKEKFVQLKSEHEKTVNKRNHHISKN
jgi:ribonuclease Y